MNISPVSQTNFGSKVIFRMPLKTGETAKVMIKGKGYNVTNVKYEIWHKGKVTDTKEYKNKHGMDNNQLTGIVAELEEKAQKGIEFFPLFSKAQVEMYR